MCIGFRCRCQHTANPLRRDLSYFLPSALVSPLIVFLLPPLPPPPWPQVSRKTPMSQEAREVALARVAQSPKSAAFTGADLQAVVDTAQLAAIHGYLAVRPI